MSDLTITRSEDRQIAEVRTADGRCLFEVIVGTDERGDYVQVRGGRLRQITVEPRADNVVRIREVPAP
jgi:hypothetical protein